MQLGILLIIIVFIVVVSPLAIMGFIKSSRLSKSFEHLKSYEKREKDSKSYAFYCPYRHICWPRWIFYFIPFLFLSIIVLGSAFFIYHHNAKWMQYHKQSIRSLVPKTQKAGMFIAYHNQIQKAYQKQFSELMVVMLGVMAIFAMVIPILSHLINKIDENRLEGKLSVHEELLELNLESKVREIVEDILKDK
ncbi:MAG: hypothetical protein GY750_01105 [Lentisphaerae bacterium]|nr:hypothetical protein [Lentisphaerota bacterium]MCP4100016.1 hypothetical protein [Lentisphaerota bacterium]